MQITSAILDDDPLLCVRLEQHLYKSSLNLSTKFWTEPKLFLHEADLLNLDIIFLDVEMPGLNGFEVLEAARKKGFTGRVIFVTAYNQYILKALRKQAFDFLLKPINPAELTKAIERYIESAKKPVNFKKLRKHGLTTREIEITELVFNGLTSINIAEKLFISPTTVNKHRTNILSKTNCNNIAELLTLL